MSDELDDIARALGDGPPDAPRGDAKARAMDAAMAAFDAADEAAKAKEGAVEEAPVDAAVSASSEAKSEKNRTTTQGTADTPRQRDRQSGLMTFVRRLMMSLTFKLPSTQTMMMGGASLAVLTFAVLAVKDMDRAPVLPPEPKPAGGLLDMNGGQAAGDAAADADRLSVPVRKGGAVESESDAANAPVAVAPVKPEPLAEDAVAMPAPAELSSGVNKNRFATKSDSAKRVKRGSAADRRRMQLQGLVQVPAQGQTQSLGGRSLTQGAAKVRREAPRVGLPAPVADQEAPIARPEDQGRDKFEKVEVNPVKVTTEDPVSTFSIDVDTASYAFMRSSLNRNVMPPKDSVRIEEMINYFPYDYAPPESRETPFSTDVTVMPTPWDEASQLMRIAIKGYEIKAAEKPKSNLVFLLDTSGSMNQRNKLPLLIQSFEKLVSTLGDDDTVSVVVYAGSAGTVLEPTKATRQGKQQILAALGRLRAGGSTAGGEGIRQAYDLAQANFDESGVNRVILATDGDFNVGIRDPRELQGFVERKRKSGVFLSVLGFGRGNYNDALMQKLAQNGNGVAAYIDSIQEAQKVLVDEASSNLFPIAKDVKIQVEFNPAAVAEYRLIGFETRALKREDFKNDAVDAGEIGAGHSVTALYEIVPVGGDRAIDDLRYGADQAEKAGAITDELAFVKIRYKQPDADTSTEISQPVTAANAKDPDTEARFAAAVAAFGQLLRGGKYVGDYSYDDVIVLANGAKGADEYGYRAEFVRLVRMAKSAAALESQRK